MTLFSPCIKPIGPADAKIVVVGEAPGEQEERTGIPFIGYSGQELDRMLQEAGIARSECLMTNVFHSRPFNNKIENFYVNKKAVAGAHNLPPLSAGKYLHPELLPELGRLSGELSAHPRNLILALGNTACWAILGTSGISKLRGAVAASPFGKVIPTYHPAAVLRDWSLRPIALADLLKARRESLFPEIQRPVRYVLINPTLEEILEYCQNLLSAKILSIDVETRGGSITCLGIASSKSEAVVVPFTARRNYSNPKLDGRAVPTDGNYWVPADEVKGRLAINQVLSSPIPKLFQNGMYDIQYLLREGYNLCNCLHDTMLLQHSLYPEMPKSLGFLGSVHTNEASWKIMRPRGGEQLKRDE